MQKNDTHIQNLINRAKQEEPVVPKEFARALLEKQALQTSAMSNIHTGSKILNIVSLASLAASVALLMSTITTSNINKNEASKIKEQNPKEQIIVQNIAVAKASNSKANENESKAISTSTTKEIQNEDISLLDSNRNNTLPTLQSIVNNSPIDIAGINPIKLTKDEIENLGFLVENGGSFSYYEWDTSKTRIWVNSIHNDWSYSGYCIKVFDPYFYINPFVHEIKTINSNFKLICNQDGEKRVCVYNKQIDDSNCDNFNSKTNQSIQYANAGIGALGAVNYTSPFKINNSNNNLIQLDTQKISLNQEILPELLFTDNPINLNELLPIEVEMIDDNGEPLYADGKLQTLIIWFEPTMEFIEKLPEQIKRKLSPEIEAIPCDYETCPTPPVTGGQPHFDVWRACSGAVENLKTYPTPVEDVLHFKYTLADDRQISMYVCNLNGEVIANPIKYEKYRKGCVEDQINVSYLNSGMYLLVISTETGEKAVQRFLVK